MSQSSPSILTSPDASMIDSLSVDELRWLEASQILDVPASPTDTFHVNNDVVLLQHKSRFSEHVQRPGATTKTSRFITTSSTSSTDAAPSKRSTSNSQTFPNPPQTPPHRSSSSQSGSPQGSPSEWLYRRPKTPKTTPVASALSSSLTLAQAGEPAPSQTNTLLRNIPKPPHTKIEIVHTHFQEPVPDTKASGNAPFWSNMIRPRSRSGRSIPLLKTIPSQSQVDIPVSHSLTHDPIPSHPISRRSPSVSSSSSSTVSSAASSAHLDTPVSSHPDPFGGAFDKPSKALGAYHRRNASQPLAPRDYRLPPLSSTSSSSSPNKSILTRASSISTKDSAGAANKSVKFVEIPTVHYSSAGSWGADAVAVAPEKRVVQPHYSNMDDMGMDVDDMDLGTHAGSAHGGSERGGWTFQRAGFTNAPWGTTSSRDRDFDNMDVDPPLRVPEAGEKSSTPGTLKRLMSLSRRSSVSTTASSKRKSSVSTTSSTSTITPSKPMSQRQSRKSMPPPPVPGKTAISGPYVLGSHLASSSSPTHSTASLRSVRNRHKTKSHSVSSSHGSGYPGLSEDYQGYRMDSAARSVRSLASIRSESSTTTTSKVKSWINKVGVGSAWLRD